MEAKLIERVALNDEFRRLPALCAWQRLFDGNCREALRAAGMPELLQAAVLVRDYLHRNGTRQGDVPLALIEAIRATGAA